ncbi:MAG: GTPase ObgE [Chloroflexi bacterium]|nr:MAG: GTPase ObgE [Phototrophicales bacterium]RMF82498.1 MAG: GTPase ObgE [Chloroflexota bacterium]
MLDEVKIYVRSGDGGDGIVSFRREKFVPRGGPNGGDGGRGGNVVLRVNPKINTLRRFQKKVHFKAERGGRGGSSNKTGANAKDLIVEVPPGTVVRDAETGAILADLVKAGETAIVARGGRGGKGNAHFKTASNQAPHFAEKGEPGEERWLILELKLIADVGLVGVPNAGKSTLLSVISNARPKIADYPFTTLEPNLGIVTLDHNDLVVADIPGLIEGAHQGVGLGHSFLRHVQRTRLLVHLLDGTSENPLADYSQINSELALYDERLGERPQIVVFTKMDLPQAQARWPEVEATLKDRGVEPMAISSATHQNIRVLIERMFSVIADLPEEQEPLHIIETPVYDLPEEEIPFTIERLDDDTYRVGGHRIERAASMTYWDNEEAIMRFQTILETLGITEALREAGIEEGDTVFIGEHELEWTE